MYFFFSWMWLLFGIYGILTNNDPVLGWLIVLFGLLVMRCPRNRWCILLLAKALGANASQSGHSWSSWNYRPEVVGPDKVKMGLVAYAAGPILLCSV